MLQVVPVTLPLAPESCQLNTDWDGLVCKGEAWVQLNIDALERDQFATGQPRVHLHHVEGYNSTIMLDPFQE